MVKYIIITCCLLLFFSPLYLYPFADYTYVNNTIEGKVIAFEHTSTSTKVYLDNSSMVTLSGNSELILGGYYKFHYKDAIPSNSIARILGYNKNKGNYPLISCIASKGVTK
jgi:hypothetical protein